MSRVFPNRSIGPINKRRHWATSHNATFGAVAPSFPRTLRRKRRAVLEQDDSNFCTAFGEAVSNGFEQDQDFSGEFQTAAESEYLGAPIINGADPYPSMQATTIMGSLPAKLSPFTLRQKGEAFIADWRNWEDSLFETAKHYRSTLIPYYIDGPYDVFDNIRNALYQAELNDEPGVVKAFGFWFDSWNDQAEHNKGRLQCPKPTEQFISRHRYTFVDFDNDKNGEPVLVAALTQGRDYGDHGYCYFDRATINQVYKNAVANGLGLYINRPTANGFVAAIAWLNTMIAWLTVRIKMSLKK